MKHASTAHIEYRCVAGVAGVETLAAKNLHLQFDRHFHESYSFGLVIRGVERCSIRRTKHYFEPGSVPMFNPGDVHDGGPATERGWSYRMVYVDPSLVGGERLFPASERRDAEAARCVRELFEAIDCGSTLGIEESLERALSRLLGHRHGGSDTCALSQVREKIDEECCDALRLRELCTLAGVSPSRLLRAFEAQYGLTPHRYQQSRRIAKAKRMILSGTALSEVAASCGYADQTHLNRWFVRIQGTTPGRFRRAFFS